MSEQPQTPTLPVSDGRTELRAARTPSATAHVLATNATRPVESSPVDSGDDPVTDWLLQRDDLDTTEFGVLFAIHKLRARRRQAGWIAQGELCRSTSLAPVALNCVLKTLRERGLVWMANHPVKAGYARYMLIVR